jgi:hypothetical protein
VAGEGAGARGIGSGEFSDSRVVRDHVAGLLPRDPGGVHADVDQHAAAFLAQLAAQAVGQHMRVQARQARALLGVAQLAARADERGFCGHL